MKLNFEKKLTDGNQVFRPITSYKPGRSSSHLEAIEVMTSCITENLPI